MISYHNQDIYLNGWTQGNIFLLKFICSEKASKFCEISTLLLTTVHEVKSKVEISQNFVAFSEYLQTTYFKLLLRQQKLGSFLDYKGLQK